MSFDNIREHLANDITTLRASQMFGIGYMDVEQWQRSVAKTRMNIDCGPQRSDLWTSILYLSGNELPSEY